MDMDKQGLTQKTKKKSLRSEDLFKLRFFKIHYFSPTDTALNNNLETEKTKN